MMAHNSGAERYTNIHTHTYKASTICAQQREHRRPHRHHRQDQANRIDNEPIKTISNVSPNLKHVVQFFEYK